MNSQRWQRVEEMFHQALEQPLAGRTEWVERACAGDAELKTEVRSLLESDAAAAGQFVGLNVEQAVIDLQSDELDKPRTLIGKQVGSYRLTQELGHGGMGA